MQQVETDLHVCIGEKQKDTIVFLPKRELDSGSELSNKTIRRRLSLPTSLLPPLFLNSFPSLPPLTRFESFYPKY